MSHLSPEELIDVAEGTSPEPSHVRVCDACRQQLSDARAMMAAVADVDVPEPSPLFWEHFSARVSDAVRADVAPVARWFTSWRVVAPLAALATALAVVIAVGVGRRPETVAPATPTTSSAKVETPVEPRALLSDDSSDPGLTFMANLAEGTDVDTTTLTTLGATPADHAVSHLSDSELRALAALLKADMPQERAS